MKSHATAIVVGSLVIAVACGCDRTTGGDPADTAATTSAETTTATTTTSTVSTTTTTTGATGETTVTMPPYGVLETIKRPLSAGEVTCEPGSTQTVEVTGGSGAPTVLMGIPEGFEQVPGDAPLNMTGPGGMTVSVSITPTALDAAAAFQRYADERTAGSEISSISLLPGDLCGYSGQEMMGSVADKPGDATEFGDRVVHVWTNNGDFLIAVHLQAAGGNPDFDAARSVVLGDFGIRMP